MEVRGCPSSPSRPAGLVYFLGHTLEGRVRVLLEWPGHEDLRWGSSLSTRRRGRATKPTNQPTNQSPLSTNHFIIVLYTNILSLSWSLECQRRSFIFSLVFARGPLWDREGKLSHSLWRVTLFFLECFLIISPPKWVRCVLHSCTCIPGRAVAVRNGAAVLA